MRYFLFLCLTHCVSFLYANEPANEKINELWQDYAEQSILDELLTELDSESQKNDASREQELTSTLLTHWEAIMQKRRWCDVTFHWDGVDSYGTINYRTKDLPHEIVQQLHTYRTKAEDLSEEELNQFITIITWKKAYIESAPDAGMIDQIIQHIYQEEYPEAARLLAQLRQEHPDYCPQVFAELAAALTSPNRLELLLRCTRLPLGVIRETHIVK